MRHRLQSSKLGRSPEHRAAAIASLVCALVERKRIETTLAKAKQARSLAEKMVTVGKQGTLTARRRALSILRRENCVDMLLKDIAPQFSNRHGGYTRILKLGKRRSDSSEMVLLEWIGIAPPERKKKPEDKKQPKP
ncbi:MAG: 50S ribosomal protein L17 [Lentisphaerae bacterium RIFOXYA12_FULL_48_11]|nr:MAG: 50S ribosomal protein L17 [Lentisphaerae bacterium RIFOXYA12_FULL_48_11]